MSWRSTAQAVVVLGAALSFGYIALGIYGTAKYESEGPVPAVIVEVHCSPRMMSHDCRTVVDVKGRRYDRPGDWGEVGDRMMVVIERFAGKSWWTSP